MRKLIVHEFMSLDGVIQAPGGKDEDTEGGFTQGGWTMPYWHDEIGSRFFEAMKEADTLLLGRKTWQIHSVFEKMDDPFAQALNKMDKIVVTKTLTSVDDWRNSTMLGTDVIHEVRKLKERPGKHILMDGSSKLLATLIENDLVDEFMLHVYPLVLGKGKRLFPNEKTVQLKLMETKPLPTGVVYMNYQLLRKSGGGK